MFVRYNWLKTRYHEKLVADSSKKHLFGLMKSKTKEKSGFPTVIPIVDRSVSGEMRIEELPNFLSSCFGISTVAVLTEVYPRYKYEARRWLS